MTGPRRSSFSPHPPRGHCLLASMALPSFLFASLLLFVLFFGFVDLGVVGQNGRYDGLPDTQSVTDPLTELLDFLDYVGYTNFTAVVRQVNADPEQAAFASAIADTSSDHTLFVPNNDAFANPAVNFNGYPYDATDTQFLSALLLYHLLPGTWAQDDFTSDEPFFIPTTLQGHNASDLENNMPQVIVCGAGFGGGILVYDQSVTTTVLETYMFSNLNLTVHEVGAVIGFPGSYSHLVESNSLSELDSMRFGTGTPSLDVAQGYTLFAPSDSVFDTSGLDMSSLNPADVWNNHVIMGQTIYSPNFTAETYTSASGFDYSFDVDSDNRTLVTLNGVTANVVHSDVLADNGVVHVIDQVLWNTTSPSLITPDVGTTGSGTATFVASTIASTSTGATTDSRTSTSSPSTGAGTGPMNGSAKSSSVANNPLSPGAIVGIVALAFIVLSVPIVFILSRRYRRRAAQGIRVRHHRNRSAFEPPTPVPFTTWYDTPTPHGKEFYSLQSSRHGSQVSLSTPPAARASGEKSRLDFRDLENNMYTYGAIPAPVGGASGVPMPRVMPMLAPEVVDHIVHQVSQRIDRARPPFPPGIPPEIGPPPGYPPSYHSRSTTRTRPHLRRTMG